jgi:N-acetylneuraminic acid mutarotase
MLIRSTSHFSGGKYYLSKFWLIIIAFMLLYIQIQAQNGWTLKSYLPTGRAGASATTLYNKIYVMGGITSSPDFTNLAVNEVYDPLTNTWEIKQPMPTARGFLFNGVWN